MVWMLTQHFSIDFLCLFHLMLPHVAISEELEAINVLRVKAHQPCQQHHGLRVLFPVVVDDSKVIESAAVLGVDVQTLQKHQLRLVNVFLVEVDYS